MGTPSSLQQKVFGFLRSFSVICRDSNPAERLISSFGVHPELYKIFLVYRTIVQCAPGWSFVTRPSIVKNNTVLIISCVLVLFWVWNSEVFPLHNINLVSVLAIIFILFQNKISLLDV
jgi:hypothetical protein